MMLRLEMEMLTRVWRGLCWVAASVVAAAAGRRGARDVVGWGSWFWLGFGLGRGRLCCRRSFLWCLGLFGVVLVLLLLVVVMVLLVRVKLSFGFRFGSGVGF